MLKRRENFCYLKWTFQMYRGCSKRSRFSHLSCQALTIYWSIYFFVGIQIFFWSTSRQNKHHKLQNTYSMYMSFYSDETIFFSVLKDGTIWSNLNDRLNSFQLETYLNDYEANKMVEYILYPRWIESQHVLDTCAYNTMSISTFAPNDFR